MKQAFSTQSIARRDGWMRVDELERDLRAAAEEIAVLQAALNVKSAGDAYAHRLDILLECALLDRAGTWEDGHALLDEYRSACAVQDEPPTFLGEPVAPARA